MAEQEEKTVWDELREPIPADRVEFRVQSINKDGWCIMLAYKDARVDMDRLDTVLGAENWQREHQLIDGQLFCKVGIRAPGTEEWIWKQDVGTESKTEAEKGRASDAFKRACFNVGIGRELYDYPLILLQLNSDEFTKYNDNGKEKGRATFNLKLKDWTWYSEIEKLDTGRWSVTKLVGVDDHGQERFRYPRTSRPSDTQSSSVPRETSSQSPASQSTSGADKDWYNDFKKDKPKIQNRINKGETPAQIMAEIDKDWKVNRATRSEIMAMVPNGEPSQDDAFDDDIPF